MSSIEQVLIIQKIAFDRWMKRNITVLFGSSLFLVVSLVLRYFFPLGSGTISFITFIYTLVLGLYGFISIISSVQYYLRDGTTPLIKKLVIMNILKFIFILLIYFLVNMINLTSSTNNKRYKITPLKYKKVNESNRIFRGLSQPIRPKSK